MDSHNEEVLKRQQGAPTMSSNPNFILSMYNFLLSPNKVAPWALWDSAVKRGRFHYGTGYSLSWTCILAPDQASKGTLAYTASYNSNMFLWSLILTFLSAPPLVCGVTTRKAIQQSGATITFLNPRVWDGAHTQYWLPMGSLTSSLTSVPLSVK